MKFVALALTILLAVGSQARSVQSDAPSQLEHVRAATMVYLSQVKETAMRTLDHLDGTDYSEYKTKLSESLDKLHEYAQTASQTLTPYGETFSANFLDATKDMRQRVMTDIEDLRTQLEPKREELNQVLKKHMDDYRAKLEPIFQEYSTKHKEEIETLRAKLQPLLEEMRTKVETNVEETKAKLLPMVELVRNKMTARLEELRTKVAPYAEEYKEQLTKAVSEVREKVGPHAQDLQGRLEPYMGDLKTRVMALYETLSEAFKA